MFLNRVSMQEADNQRRRSPWFWLFVLLFPIPFTPWWLGLSFLAAFCIVVWAYEQDYRQRW